jgi:succinate dehydrogenase / fumarate reductase flavoprotein subunit
MKGGGNLADPNAVYGLVKNAPKIVNWLWNLGVPFTLNGSEIDLRSFGGQKKKRTAYAKSSTGKMIMTALIDETRKYEAKNLVHRLPHHEFVELLIDNHKCVGCKIKDIYSDKVQELYGSVILATGSLSGFFEGATTGTTQNNGNVAATVFRQGVTFGNLEMIQYHPTTIQISGKRLLVSEAARGEGGRLYVLKNGKPWYFMEELYPEYGNLATRDVVSREMVKVVNMPECDKQVYLDMTELTTDIWNGKLSDLRNEIIHYLAIDPAKEPVPVKPGIHYFMGGILVDEKHKTNIDGLYAAGECACQYHGANRLGGNSMLGAIYGGQVAGETASIENTDTLQSLNTSKNVTSTVKKLDKELQSELLNALGIIRDEATIQSVIDKFEKVQADDKTRFSLAMLYSARDRKESRGAHFRSDYSKQSDEFQKTTIAEYKDGKIQISFREIPKLREKNGA